MKKISWSTLKSERLKRARGVSFEEMISSKLIGIKEHHIHVHQRIMLFEHRNYIWLVPFVETDEGIFLKTLYPSRKYTKIYRGRKK